MITNPTIIIDNLIKYFHNNIEKPAINCIATKIMPGKITGLVGPDGAGKTTLIRLLVGLMQPSKGSIIVDSFDTKTNSEEIHQIVGYMPQRFGLYEDLTVIENLKLYADLWNITGCERQEKFVRLLQFTNLNDFQERLANDLSGGMKQKLGLACALLGDPKILLLDEPSVGIDPLSRRDLWHMVKELSSDSGMTVIWSTSYLDEAEKCDNVILLNEGNKLFDGAPLDLVQSLQGRVWQIREVNEQDKRKVLMKMLKEENVIDGVIQGRNIRIVFNANSINHYEPNLKFAIKGAKWVKVAPWFEDGFIDILGGVPHDESILAKQIAEKPLSNKPVIIADKLTKKFGNFTAVNNNSFVINRGEIFGLLGPNGSGKSTTFKMMCGLLQPTSGQGFVMGLDLKTASSQARSHIGYMAQKFSLYGNLNVLQNLYFFSGVYGLSGEKQKEQIGLMIEIFDLKDHLKINSNTLPLGFKQRLALACSVMHQPSILFLDEPTSGVDPLTRREFWMHINAMVEKGVTIMVTTHFMDEAEYCDRIGLIYKGENIATGTPDDLKKLASANDFSDPTLEDAFIALIKNYDQSKTAKSAYF